MEDEKKRYLPSDQMSHIINDNPLLLMAMSRFGISLGFGDKTVAQACDDQSVDCATFLSVANFISYGIVDLTDISVESLMTYLQHAHTYFLDFCLPLIRRKLIEAIDCSGRDKVAMMILKFYDEYVEEVHRHMEHENDRVFRYVQKLLEGVQDEDYNIRVFASGHHSIHNKLLELKNIIVRYLPQKENNLLNAVLFDIINCEQDLVAHCQVEDKLFVPVVKNLEASIDEMPRTKPEDGEDGPTDPGLLSSREKEIIALVAQGMSNKEIADHLCISINTVTTHRRNLAQKLQIHSPAGLAIYAVLNNLVDINALKP